MSSSYLNERCSWPQMAATHLQATAHKDHLLRAILHQRLGEQSRQEAQLLAILQGCRPEEIVLGLEALSGLRVQQGQLDCAKQLLDHCSRKRPQSCHSISLRFYQRQLALSKGVLCTEQKQDAEINSHPLLQLQEFQDNLKRGDQAKVSRTLEQWPPELNTPEGIELRGLAYKALGQEQKAAEVLSDLLGKHPGSASAWVATLELNYTAGRNNSMALATATRRHPREPGVATHRVLIELQQRQPGLARRSAFKERLLYSLGKRCPSRMQSDANLIYTYDHTGRCDLTQCLHPSLVSQLAESPPLHTNVAMQLASLASPLYGPRAEAIAASLPKNRTRLSGDTTSKQLRVGLISSDLYYHPVGRFVQMLLARGFGQTGELHLINTGQSALAKLQDLSNKRLHDLSGVKPQQRLETIRNLQLDVAIDLAGWTGGNNSELFAAGLAPLQVNYLGYFASTGIPSMDIWLGDSALFPDPMQEWHSERIVRLPRPFLAWQPDPTLPEGRVEVPPAPGGPITFGCFNHVRKLSAPTLRLWAKLLQTIPGSRLALKAFASDDPAVMALLNRRMRRCGLDPEAVIWLPTCPKPEDHLRQYGLIDIALDPFPNGGCTTTCEALWMGVPVITLCGTHYVSRMATAVLRGANLPEWVAANETEYLQIARRAADQLSAIRSGREQLRAHLQASPLGDAADLADHLWRCFEQLVQEQRLKAC